MSTLVSMVQSTLFGELTTGRLNPPAVVDQLRMLPMSMPTEELIAEIEAEYARTKKGRDEAMEGLARLLVDEPMKDDGEEFSFIVRSFEAMADEVGAKLLRLEKAVHRVQKREPHRDIRLDERLLNVARLDFEDRVDASVFWRALQAKIWPSPVSDSFATGADIGKALRAAIG